MRETDRDVHPSSVSIEAHRQIVDELLRERSYLYDRINLLEIRLAIEREACMESTRGGNDALSVLLGTVIDAYGVIPADDSTFATLSPSGWVDPDIAQEG